MEAISATFLPQISPISRKLPTIFNNPGLVPFLLKKRPIRNPKFPRGFGIFAEGNGVSRDEAGGRESGEVREDLKGDRPPPAFNVRWRDLLNPDPENILAVGLTGLLTWASVQVLWQLFFISIAIVFAALKYSFIAALLLFILITLL